jgi:hypothetical protein
MAFHLGPHPLAPLPNVPSVLGEGRLALTPTLSRTLAALAGRVSLRGRQEWRPYLQ